jgi:response regulator NasT
MQNSPIILCSDNLKQQALMSAKLALCSDKIIACQLKQLEQLIEQEPEARLVACWQQPSAELNLIIDFAEKKLRPLVVFVHQLNSLSINRIKESSGYVLLPSDSNFELSAWLTFAEQARQQQVESQREIAKLNLKLAERKQVEIAKGLLMKLHQLDEESAFKALRNSAMQNSQSLGQVARNIITALSVVSE